MERAQRVQLVAGGEMDTGNLGDDIAQEVTAFHPIVNALEDGGNDIAAVVAVGTGERAQVEKEALPLLAVGQRGLVLIDECQ